ncbi:N-acetylglucosamine-6-phosphate deacetylase [Virgisporangium aliadipatigenens]|uniref:N-acetylglucosamine-6-phosphate deacetylase n=1 Tax=Virgisporangium aliadipatigenens TaxID=741659 RepID=A0A8J3YS51_9ACTN|nr:N-acetylglucosamine-6-phosphate deacetylase [Virgisporangium aliadipatigenens]GIJ49413.1 N-acetylglucosamine-6-phosphate deacetylase [Virgisporangium aliadipatigenens]
MANQKGFNMRVGLTNCRAVQAGAVLPDATVVFDGGVVSSITAGGVPADWDEEVNCQGKLVTAGLIDIQINGGGGHMFSLSSTSGAYEEILRAHASLGTTSVCPTIISGPLDDMENAVRLAASFAEQNVPANRSRVLGIHIEGPFLSAGKRGGHAEEYLLEPSVEVAQRLIDAGGGHVRIFTLAPELPGSAEVIRFLRQRGVFVSLGHSKAEARDAAAAFRQGARGATHLFNAMEGMTSRAPGLVGASIADPDVYVGIIGDLLHVDAVAVRAALLAKGPHRAYLTTDAVSPLGALADSFDLYGVRVSVRDGGCYTDSGVLAGTATPLATMVRNMVDYVGLSVPAAVQLATRTPAEVIGKHLFFGSLSGGMAADAVVWNDDMSVDTVWIGGHECSSQWSRMA